MTLRKLSEQLQMPGLLRATPQRVAEMMMAPHGRAASFVRVLPLRIRSLREAAAFLAPVTFGPVRTLLLSRGDWTLLLSSNVNGAGEQMPFFARKLATTGLDAVYTARGCRWRVSQGGTAVRDIVCIDDGGRWSFGESGTPQPYEQTERYALPRRRERLTAQMVRDYLQAASGIAYPLDWTRAFAEQSVVALCDESPVRRRSFDTVDDLDAAPAAEEPTAGGEAWEDVVSLERFFGGNTDLTSIGCNLGETHPGQAVFEDVLRRLRERPDVQDVLVEVSAAGPAGASSGRVYVLTRASRAQLQDWAAPLHPEPVEGPLEVLPPGLPPLQPGHAVFALWWD